MFSLSLRTHINGRLVCTSNQLFRLLVLYNCCSTYIFFFYITGMLYLGERYVTFAAYLVIYIFIYIYWIYIFLYVYIYIIHVYDNGQSQVCAYVHTQRRCLVCVLIVCTGLLLFTRYVSLRHMRWIQHTTPCLHRLTSYMQMFREGNIYGMTKEQSCDDNEIEDKRSVYTMVCVALTSLRRVVGNFKMRYTTWKNKNSVRFIFKQFAIR